MKPTKLSELIEGIEFDSDEYAAHVDLQNGIVVRLPQSLLSAVEESAEDVLDRTADWEPEEVEIARAIVEDSGERFVAAPDMFGFHEYRHMERFIGTVESAEATEQLWRAIKGKGAYRCFKDTASRLGLLEQWFRHREAALKEFVLAWAEAKNVPYEDDIQHGK